ncbi:uracil phosphoribosyltransferase [Verrucomicrobiota bacterium]|nr:uracil phosphoribosyltransferase [Verrucomicrobiota bacterium]
MKNVTVIDHPLVQHNLTRLRDRETSSTEFRRLVGEVATLMIYEATRSLAVGPRNVVTPVGKARGTKLTSRVLLVPILRAGLGMLDSILQLIPDARVGFIGLKRDEATLQAITYHQSLPASAAGYEVIILDPMLATGGSAIAALDLVKARGAKCVRMVNLLAAPEGIQAVLARHPDTQIYTAAIDQKLNARGYIVPGLGDAGDRIFSS